MKTSTILIIVSTIILLIIAFIVMTIRYERNMKIPQPFFEDDNRLHETSSQEFSSQESIIDKVSSQEVSLNESVLDESVSNETISNELVSDEVSLDKVAPDVVSLEPSSPEPSSQNGPKPEKPSKIPIRIDGIDNIVLNILRHGSIDSTIQKQVWDMYIKDIQEKLIILKDNKLDALLALFNRLFSVKWDVKYLQLLTNLYEGDLKVDIKLNESITLSLREMSNNFLLFVMLKHYNRNKLIDTHIIEEYRKDDNDIRLKVCQNFFDNQILSGEPIQIPSIWLQMPTEDWSQVFGIIFQVKNPNEVSYDIHRCFFLCVMLHYQPILESRCRNLPNDIFKYMSIIKPLAADYFKSNRYCCPELKDKIFPRKPCNITQVYSSVWNCRESFLYYVQTRTFDIIQKYGSNGIFVLKYCHSVIHPRQLHLIPKQWRRLECYRYIDFDFKNKQIINWTLHNLSELKDENVNSKLMEQDISTKEDYIESNGKYYKFEFHFRLFPNIDYQI